jgi:hypothetical protein
MDEKNWTAAEGQVPVIGAVMQNVAAAIDQTADSLEEGMAQPH